MLSNHQPRRSISAVVLVTFLLLCRHSMAQPVSNNGSCALGDPDHCTCDPPLCYRLGDCCSDVIQKAAATVNLTAPILSTDIQLSCAEDGYYIVNKCPPRNAAVDATLRAACEAKTAEKDGLEYGIPVKNEDNILFKNVHCAYCNGLSASSITRIPINATCIQPFFGPKPIITPTYFKENLGLGGLCKFVLSSAYKKKNLRKCYTTAINSCSKNTSKQSMNKCLADPMWITWGEGSGKMFRNPACCKCNLDAMTTSCVELDPRPVMFLEDSTMTGVFDFFAMCASNCPTIGDSAGTQTETGEQNGTNATASCPDVKVTTQRKVMGMLTTVFCGISMVALFVMVGAYLCLPELRNFGGLMSIALSCTIFLNHTLLILSSHISRATLGCIVVGTLMHFTFLSSFMWMALFAIDLLRTFYGPQQHSASKPLRRLAKFALVGYGLPVLVVTLGSILDATLPTSPVSPAYGVCRCWLNKMWANLLWFLAPVSLILLFNCTACVLAFIYLYKAARDTRQVRSQSSGGQQSMLLLCVKLTTLFGLFWILQIIAVFLRVEIISDVIGLVNSLQGFLIGFCFLFTKRVKKAARDSVSHFTSRSDKDKGSTTYSSFATKSSKVVNQDNDK